MRRDSSLDYNEYIVSDSWKWGDDDRYTFATGYIRSIEHRLIPSDRFIRLADARTTDDIMAMLGDTDYVKGYQDEMVLMTGGSSGDIDVKQVILQEAKRVKKFVEELTRDKEQTDCLFIRDDYLNLKLSIKGMVGNVAVEDSFAPLGLTDPALIYQETRDAEKSDLLPRHLKEAAVRAIKAYGETSNPAEIDRVVDALMFEDILDRTMRSEVFFLNKLVMMEIDLINIITFFRLKWIGDSLTSLQSALIKGGRVPSEAYYEFFSREIDDIETSLLSDDAYSGFVSEGVQHLKNENSFIGMEARVDREIMKVVNREK
ncbi:MAG: V-type ATPase subunit, partial [Candidatus Dadabacteria bacterium]|nr:V-type ATPase subunit [Candidatus Dadabacteria bacterium]